MIVTDIFTNVPFYVWPLFAALIVTGLRARKTHVVPLKRLLMMSALFFTWGAYSIMWRSDIFQELVLWEGLIAGACIGYLLTRCLQLRIDRTNMLVELPGTWLTLTMALSIFTIKFALGAIQSIQPDLQGSWMLIALELLAAIISGFFLGRGLGIWSLFQTSQNVSQQSL